jgi:hypothetical protein
MFRSLRTPGIDQQLSIPFVDGDQVPINNRIILVVLRSLASFLLNYGGGRYLTSCCRYGDKVQQWDGLSRGMISEQNL